MVPRSRNTAGRASARRATRVTKTTRRAAVKGAHLPRKTEHAHGYGTTKLKVAPKDRADAEKVLASIKVDLEAENAKFPGKAAKKGYRDEKPPKVELSLMEDTAKHKNNTSVPGKDVIVFVSFNPVPWGRDVAHEHIHDLMDAADKNPNCAQGLANHWCCYSDM